MKFPHTPNARNRLHFNIRKITAITAMILLSCLFVFGYTLVNDRRTFDALSRELFVSELAANTLNMHYTIAYPENFGIDYIPQLTPYVPANSEARADELNDIILSLEGITAAFLKPDDRYTYHLLKSYLLNMKDGQRFHLFDEPLSPGSGAQVMLPILLNDYTFRSVADVENYLQVLDQIDDYLAGLCAFEREKAAAGLFMSDHAVIRVIEQCDMIIDKNAILSETHFLQISFKERVRALAGNGLITNKQAEAFIAENNRLLLAVIAPAYTRTGDELFLLKGSGTNEMGLAHFPDGQEYYLHLLAQTTGSKRSIAEIKDLLFSDFRHNYDALVRLLQRNPELLNIQSDAEIPFTLHSPEAMLLDLEEKTSADFPSFADASRKRGALPENPQSIIHPLTIKNVSPAMEDYASPAYYLTPPIDYYWENTIYINQKNNLTGLSLYTTLAHEGYPGHLYQTVYNRIFMEQTDGNPLRYILHFGGYQEGWALYVEMGAFDFAKNLMINEYPEVEFLYEYFRLTHALQLGLYSLLDIAIHYDGADFIQVKKMLKTIGIAEDDVCLSIFDYIICEPANYPKYYLGYLEIMALKNEAKVLWGAKYSDYEFHRVFLEAGPSDFEMLGELVRRHR